MWQDLRTFLREGRVTVTPGVAAIFGLCATLPVLVAWGIAYSDRMAAVVGSIFTAGAAVIAVVLTGTWNRRTDQLREQRAKTKEVLSTVVQLDMLLRLRISELMGQRLLAVAVAGSAEIAKVYTTEAFARIATRSTVMQALAPLIIQSLRILPFAAADRVTSALSTIDEAGLGELMQFGDRPMTQRSAQIILDGIDQKLPIIQAARDQLAVEREKLETM